MRNPEPISKRIAAERVGDGDNGWLVHADSFAKLFRKGQAKNTSLLCEHDSQDIGGAMSDEKPFADIAARLLWHRQLLDLTQEQYAERLGVKRARYSRWEAGKDRLSLDGALALRKKYGLSLDFMYEGIDDALPMTLRNAWLDKP